MRKYKVTLTADERQSLKRLITAGSRQAHPRPHPAQGRCRRGRPPAWTDERIAQALEINVRTVERLRERFVE